MHRGILDVDSSVCSGGLLCNRGVESSKARERGILIPHLPDDKLLHAGIQGKSILAFV